MTIPVLGTMGFGRWGAQLTAAEVATLLHQAADLGVMDIDLADIYGDYTTNALVGAALAAAPDLRPRLRWIAKVGIRLATTGGSPVHHYDASVSHLRAAIEGTFADLGVTHLHQIVLHRFDYLAEPAAIAELLSGYFTEGRVGAFGLSNCSPARVALFQAHLPVSLNQVSLSLADTAALEDGTHAHAVQHGYELQAWGPLAGGRLVRAGDPLAERMRDALQRAGAESGLDAAQVALAWVAALPQVRPVIGAARLAHLEAAVRACATPLPREAWYALLEAARGARVP